MSQLYCYRTECAYRIEKGYIYGGLALDLNLPNKLGEWKVVKASRKCPHCKKRMTLVSNFSDEDQ